MNIFDQNYNRDGVNPIFLDENTPLINGRTFPRTLSRLPLTTSRIWPCNPPPPCSAPVWDRPEEGGEDYLLQLLSASEPATTPVFHGLKPWESPELMPETIISLEGLDVKLLQPGTEHLQASYILSFTKQTAHETSYQCVGCQLRCPCLTALQAHLMSSWELHGACSIIYKALGMKKPTKSLVQTPSTAPQSPVWLSYFPITSYGFSNAKKGHGKEKKCPSRKRGREDHESTDESSTTAPSPLGPTNVRGEERQSGPASKRGREEFRSPSPQAGPSRKMGRSRLQDLSTPCKTTKRLREEEETEEAGIPRKRPRKTKYLIPDC